MTACASAKPAASAEAAVVSLAPSAAASDRQSLRTLAILSVLMAFGPISTDLYLPALPTMAGALRAGRRAVTTDAAENPLLPN